MASYTFIVTLVDTGLPYPTKEEAIKAVKEWGKDLAAQENCMCTDAMVVQDNDD